MIFMNFLSRNSRATGPKMRVPFGFSSLSMMTHGVAVKAQIRAVVAADGLPGADDHRVVHLALFHRPSGAASLMWTLMTSPMPA